MLETLEPMDPLEIAKPLPVWRDPVLETVPIG